MACTGVIDRALTARHALYTLLVLVGNTVLPSTGQIPKEFTVTSDQTSFQVSVGQVKLFDHSLESPILFVGSGVTEVTEETGNYVFEEYTVSRIPLKYFTIEEEPYVTRIQLAASTTLETPVTVELSTTSTHQLAVSVVDFPTDHNRAWIRIHADTSEHVYGAGEQFSYFDLRGRNYPIWVREQGVGRNESHPIKYLSDVFAGNAGGDYHTTYFPQASFVSSRRYSCFMTGSSYMDLNFEPEHFHELSVHGAPGSLLLQTGTSMLDVVQHVAGYFGHQPPLPEWLSQGAVIGMQGGTQRMLEILTTAQENGLAVTGMWIQDWCGSIITPFGKRVYWNWEWDPEHYPGLDTEIWRLRDEGVYLLAYMTGHVIVNGTIYSNGTGRGYFMMDTEGEEYLIDFGQFFCATVDLTNPEARQWYKGVITRNLIDFGFGGWMADFGEYIPYDSVFYNGETGETMHNKYSVLWAQLNREAVEEAGKLGEIMFFMRSGGPGSQSYSLNSWAGDQNVDWSKSDGLASTVPAVLSLGMSGFGLSHFDIGGYTTMQVIVDLGPVAINLTMTRSEELFFRGAEYAVFTTMMRTHEGNRPDLNFQVYNSNETLQQFAVLVEMFKALSNYTTAVMIENAETGIPVQRPLFLHYENDETTYTLDHQYMLGRDLLVAPVVEQRSTLWRAYLPADDWRYLYDDRAYSGGEWVTVQAPLGKPPVFYINNSEWVDVFKTVADIANSAQFLSTCDSYEGCP